jgi:hypothetical protein
LASRATKAQAVSRAFYTSKRNRLNRRYTAERRRRTG